MDIYKTLQNVENPIFDDSKPLTKIEELEVAITSIQDLHGYNKPWPAGGGKNLLPLTLNTLKQLNTQFPWVNNEYTRAGITFKAITDHNQNVTAIIANGTATANTYLRITPVQFSIPANTIINGCPKGGSVETYCIRILEDDDTTVIGTETGNGFAFETTYPSIIAWLKVGIGATVNNVIFRPMLRLASETDPTFAPYSNICPIIGHDFAKITLSDDNRIVNDISITFPKTIYGGSVDLTQGLLTIDKARVIMNTSQMGNAEMSPGWNNVPWYQSAFPESGFIPDAKTSISLNIRSDSLSNTVFFVSSLDLGGVTETQLKAMALDVEIVYPLANPIIIPISFETLYTYPVTKITANIGNVSKLTYIVNPLLLGRHFMINSGYVLLDCGNLDMTETDPQTVSGIWNRAVNAVNTGKPIWIHTAYDSDAEYSPIPVFARFDSTTTIICNAAGFTITITSGNTVTVAVDS